MQHRDATVGQGLCVRPGVMHLPLDQTEITPRMVGRIVGQHQVSQPGQRFTQGGEGVIRPDITVDHHKGFLAEQWQCTEDPAAGFQRFAFRRILNLQAVARTVAQVVFNLLPQPGVIDHHLAETGCRQRPQVILDQWHPPHAHQRLGRGQCQRAHALTLAGRQNHCLHAVAPTAARRLISNVLKSASSGRRASTASI
ncbi:hypothetical protein D3C78_940580 [compost metagenome]